MLEPEVMKGLAAAVVITLGLVVFLVAIEAQQKRHVGRIRSPRW